VRWFFLRWVFRGWVPTRIGQGRRLLVDAVVAFGYALKTGKTYLRG
jgi:hypothetical protein